MELAKIIDKHSGDKNIRTNILIEVNLTEENTKNGIQRKDTLNLVKELRRLAYLKLLGLMAMPPLAKEPEENRKYFRELKELLEEINGKGIYGSKLNTLSMGTSHDFEVAVEEGATIVRLGTVVFGKRPQKDAYK